MAGDIDSERAELLDEAPDFRTRCADFVGDFCATDDDGGMVDEKLDNAAETGVGGGVRRGTADFGGGGDGGIIVFASFVPRP